MAHIDVIVLVWERSVIKNKWEYFLNKKNFWKSPVTKRAALTFVIMYTWMSQQTAHEHLDYVAVSADTR